MARNRSRAAWLFVVASTLPVSPGAVGFAQTSTRVLTGTVFDSAAGIPLAGAAVQLVQLNQADARVWATATFTDAKGRYRIEGVRPGQYLVGFQHDALNAFRVEAPARRVDVPASTTAADQNIVVGAA